MAAIQKNILEHISLMAQEQVELEFREQMQQMMMMQQQAATRSTSTTTTTTDNKSHRSKKSCVNCRNDRRF